MQDTQEKRDKKTSLQLLHIFKKEQEIILYSFFMESSCYRLSLCDRNIYFLKLFPTHLK